MPAPLDGVQLVATSGVVGATAAVATLAAVSDKLTYISGFQCSGLGATAAAIVQVTVAGLLGGTLTYLVSVPAGAALPTSPFPLAIKFDPPLPASAHGVAIVVTMPSFGAGNTVAITSAQGFQL